MRCSILMHARCCLRSGLQRMEFYKFSLVQLYAVPLALGVAMECSILFNANV